MPTPNAYPVILAFLRREPVDRHALEIEVAAILDQVARDDLYKQIADRFMRREIGRRNS